MSFDSDYYELLEVERTADEKTLKTSYRRLAMECHPDRNPGCEKSEAKFKAIKRAAHFIKHNAAAFPGGRAPSEPLTVAVAEHELVPVTVTV